MRNGAARITTICYFCFTGSGDIHDNGSLLSSILAWRIICSTLMLSRWQPFNAVKVAVV
jgi:hypothetical protein